MKKKFYLTLLSLGMFYAANAQQNHKCGFQPDQESERRLRSNIEHSHEVQQRGGLTWIPVKFHIVGDNTGAGYESETDIFDNICKLNADYLPQNIHFYLQGDFDYWNNTTVYNHTNQFSATTAMAGRKTANCLNIFVGNSADGGTSTGGTTLGYYQTFSDYIFAIKSSVNGTSTTLTHEIGHFFSLLHPFNGWENDVWADVYAANGNQTPTSIGGNQVELQARTNCNNAGDFMCSTYPDYNLGFGWSNCNYTGGAVDPNGVIVNPDEDNYMGYYLGGACQTTFTTEQQNAISADISSRNWTNFNPSTTATLSGTTTVNNPASGQTTPFFNNIVVDWAAVTGATKYLVQIWRSTAGGTPLGSAPLAQTITTSLSYTVPAVLNPGQNYLIKILAYNPVDVCGSFATSVFKTGSIGVGVQNISSISTVSVSPNPIASGQNFQLDLNLIGDTQLGINLFGMDGKLVRNYGLYNLQAGENSLSLDGSCLSAGVYTLTCQNNTGTTQVRLLVID